MRIGVALSGGFVKGVAHIGFLEALEEKGLVPAVVAGSSAGALVGAFYCAGFSPKEILKIAKETRWRDLARPCLRGGIFKLNGLREKLKSLLGEITFSELKIPLIVTALNLTTLEVEFFSDGYLLDPLVASCSAPPLFAPIKIENFYYADGGIRNCLPAEAAKSFGCNVVICSNANTPTKTFNPHSITDVSLRASLAGILENQASRLKYCNIVISYEFSSSQFDFSQVENFYQEGYKKTKTLLKEVERWI